MAANPLPKQASITVSVAAAKSEQKQDAANVLLVCGYKTSGKDTFYASMVSDEPIYKYVALGHPSLATKKVLFPRNMIQLSFANVLKKEVNQSLRDKYGAKFTPEAYVKDKKLKDYATRDSCLAWVCDESSLRDYYISRAAVVRAEDPYYYAKVVKALVQPGKSYCITD